MLPVFAAWLNALAFLALAVLLLFAARRFVFLLTLFRPQLAFAVTPSLPTILLLIPIRDESASLPALFESLDGLEYPDELLQVLLIDDGSTDESSQLMDSAVRERSGWRVLHLPVNVGKAQALNTALAGEAFGEIVYIFDADHRPRQDCLRVAASAFADPRVAGVSGRTIPSNALASPAAYYSAVEALVHQLVTMRGKDILRLSPALLGSNNGYRRAALAQVGGFRRGAFLEDSDLTLAFHRAGYTTRFIPQAVSTHRVPSTARGYVRQHARWGRGFNDVARAHTGAVLSDGRLSIPMRIELALFSLGYLDRLAFLAAILLAAFGVARLPLLIGIGLSLILPLAQIVGAFIFDRAPWAMWLRLPLLPLFFALDAATAAWALTATLLDLPRVWSKTERA